MPHAKSSEEIRQKEPGPLMTPLSQPWVAPSIWFSGLFVYLYLNITKFYINLLGIILYIVYLKHLYFVLLS